METEALGKSKLSIVDRFGAHLSRAPILKVVRGYRDPVLLDIGCGYGASMLLALEPLILRGVGIDESVSPAAKERPKLSFLEDSIENTMQKLEPESFDIVMMISVLEHLWEPVAVLEGCRRLLRPRGSLVLNVPNWLGKEFLEFSAFRLGMSAPDSIDDHKTYYSKKDLWPVLVRAGFKPRRIRMHYHKLGLNLFAVAVKP